MQRSAPERATAPPRSDVPFDQSIVPASPGQQSQGLAGRAFKGFRSWLKDAVVVLAVMYIVPWFALSFGVAAIDSALWRPSQLFNSTERSIAADLARPFGLLSDPGISADRAGLAFQALQPEARYGGEFRYRDVDHPLAPWRTWKFDPNLFGGSVSRSSWNGPGSQYVLGAVSKGLSAREKEALRVIGTAPVWREYDLFARAPSADLVGGRFDLPFSPAATFWAMPIPSFAATKELAYASVSRAAWHLSEGRRDSAEFALRATISFGRVLSTNAPTPIEQLIGNVITGIGRAGLREFYTITHNPRLASLPVEMKNGRYESAVPRELREIGDGTLAEQRQRLIVIATTPTFDRAVRQSALKDLALSSCTRIGELLTGPNASVRAAFTQARRDLVRSPGEAATLDLIENALTRYPLRNPNGFEDAAQSIGHLFFNPRLGSCALMATSFGQNQR